MPTYPIEQASKIVAEGLPIGPRMYPCVCSAPRAIHGGTAGKGRCVETNCGRYRADLAYELAYKAVDAQAASVNDAMKEWERRQRAAMRAARPKLDGQWSIGASDAGRCRAQIGYRENPPEDYTPLIEDKRAARMGGIIDDEITSRYKVLYPWRLHQHWVTIEGLDRESRLDMFDPVTGRLTDLKCTTLDTPVLMADGTEKPAGSVVEGDRVAAWDESARSLTSASVAWSGPNGVQPIYRVDTRSGRTLRVTAEHPILTVRVREGRRTYEWVKADGIEPGMRVLAALGWKPDGTGEIGPQDAYLLGALTGDGSTSRLGKRRYDGRGYYGASFTNLDEGILSAVDAALRTHGGRLSDYREGSNRASRHIVFDRDNRATCRFEQWLTGLDMIHTAHGKRVPDAIMRSGPDAWAGFLSGLLDTDGTVFLGTPGCHYARLSWCSVSHTLLRQCQQLLAGLGVGAALHTVKGTYKRSPYVSYGLAVGSTEGITTLAPLLSLQGAKAKRLEEAVANAARRRADHIRPADLVTVTAVTIEPPEPTWGITVAGVHTHITSGLVSHNTAGMRSWDRVGENGPYEEAWKQVDLYALGMEDEGHTVREVAIAYVNRDNGHDETYVREHDRARGEAVRQELLGVATALDLGMPLPRDGMGPETDWRCRLCPARAHCWNLDAAQVAGRSGESFTILGAKPDDESIIWAADQYVGARELRLDAEKHEKESRVLLDGIEAGEFGEFLAFTKRTGGTPNYKGTTERLLELLDLPDGQRPAAADVPLEHYAQGQTMVWKRKRKATRERKARDANVATDAGAA
jgi:hypothetical protein